MAAGSRCTTPVSAQLRSHITRRHSRPPATKPPVPRTADVTVVIPVPPTTFSGLLRLVGTLRGMRVVVVDDGSAQPVYQSDFADMHCDIQVLRHTRSKGPRGGAQHRLAACSTDFVAFLDSDVVPRRGWLEAFARHFCDPPSHWSRPGCGAAASRQTWVARYEAVRLRRWNLGLREAPVGAVRHGVLRPQRRHHLPPLRGQGTGGFDETLKSGEDVDLCWRFIEAGARLRYEPSRWSLTTTAHRCGNGSRAKSFYGRISAPLSVRHPGKTAPLVISGWTLVVWILLAMGSGIGYLALDDRRRHHGPSHRPTH